MRIAIVGAGLTGLSAAHFLGEDPRHVTTVFETRAQLGGQVEELLVEDSVHRLGRLGVTLRRTAQVERLAVDDGGVHLWINGVAERFDVALVATPAADRRALLARSGIRRPIGSTPLRKRVYFTEDGSARSALDRMAADHPNVRPSARMAPDARARVARAWRSLARLASGHVEYLDLSGELWPLESPAVFIASRRWILDAVVPHHLTVGRVRTPEPDDTAAGTVGVLEDGTSLAVVADGDHPARVAGLAALAANAPIVPIVARNRPAAASRLLRPHPRVRVVIGQLFYPETSSIEELMDNMRMVIRHLERLAIEHGRRSPPVFGELHSTDYRSAV